MMKKISFIFVVMMLTLTSMSQHLLELSKYGTDTVFNYPVKYVVSGFHVDWGIGENGIDTAAQSIIIDYDVFLMTPDTTKVIKYLDKIRHILYQGTEEFNQWYNADPNFGIMLYQFMEQDTLLKDKYIEKQ